MKKNKMMRLAAVLLVAVLMTTCAISGTFAKYITQDDGSDFARVAKWGVVIEAEDFDMFTTDYETEDTSKYTGEFSVSSATTDRDDVLAPGTTGSFADIKITGTPEVAVDVAIVATVELSDNWVDADDSFYCPIVITINDTTFCGLDYDNAGDFADAIKANIDGKSAQYAPNTNLATTYDNSNLDISWEWAFDDAAHVELDCECVAGAQNDIDDTFLGDAAVEEDLTISIAVDITVTQID